ncbi:MAG TPA: cell division protein ZapA [Xanthomonadaceae bacterium]|nr:cell division protein ZapA [Xanthomonadaceae bacterium]
MSATEAVSVTILDRELTLACSAEERESLVDTAQDLDRRLRELRTSHRAVGIDRLALLLALNLAHELRQIQHGAGPASRGADRAIADMRKRVGAALDALEAHFR